MNNCTDLFLLSSIACSIADCLDEDELSVTAARLTTLGDMLATLATQRALCPEKCNLENVIEEAKEC